MVILLAQLKTTANKMNLIRSEPWKGHFFSDIYQKRNYNKNMKMEIKTTNISFKRIIISFKRYNNSFKRDIFRFDCHSNFLVSVSVLINTWKGKVLSGVLYIHAWRTAHCCNKQCIILSTLNTCATLKRAWQHLSLWLLI